MFFFGLFTALRLIYCIVSHTAQEIQSINMNDLIGTCIWPNLIIILEPQLNSDNIFSNKIVFIYVHFQLQEEKKRKQARKKNKKKEQFKRKFYGFSENPVRTLNGRD